MEQKKINFTEQDVDEVTIMRVKDPRLDSRISSLYKQEFVAMKDEGIRQVVVDLSEVEFIDSSGLGALLLGRRLFTSDEGDLRVIGAHEKVLSMFKIAKLDRVFEFFDGDEEAVKSFGEAKE
jgi:anti-sigma B factor antagonist